MGLRFQTAPAVLWLIGSALAGSDAPATARSHRVRSTRTRPPRPQQSVKRRALGSADARIPTTLAP